MRRGMTHERVQPRRKVAGAQLAQAGALDSDAVDCAETKIGKDRVAQAM